jgi:hypothetical protein
LRADQQSMRDPGPAVARVLSLLPARRCWRSSSANSSNSARRSGAESDERGRGDQIRIIPQPPRQPAFSAGLNAS